jgi:hypothetical protein
MSQLLSKFRVALAGAAVVVVVGLATPSTLGAVSVAIWSHGGAFDVSGADHLGLCLLDAIAWSAWARIAVGLGGDVVSGLRGRNDLVRSASVRGVLAGWVVGLALMVLPSLSLGGGPAGATTAANRVSISATVPTSVTAPASSLTADSSVTASTASGSVNTPAPEMTYTVRSGDCLSTIALHFYGDEGAWTEIWAANADRLMGDGMRFIDPNLIYAGWTLDLPGLTDAAVPNVPTPANPTPTSTPKVATPGHSSAAPKPIFTEPRRPSDPGTRPFSADAPPTTVVAPTTDLPRRSPSSAGHLGDAGEGGAEHSHRTADEGTSSPTAAPTEKDTGEPLVHWLPESAALGISALVAAVYLRRIRRRRSAVRAARGDDEIVVDPDPAAVALEARLAPFAGAPALEWLELANRHLTAALRSEGSADDAPQITVVRVGPFGVELLLDAAVDWAPGAFRVVDGGHTWLLDSGVDREALWPVARDELAWLPLLVPVGDDPSGTYLLHLEPGQEVALEGPQAPAMLAAWMEAAKSWPWAEQVSVAADAESAESLTPLFAGQVSVDQRGAVMFAGDPGTLSEEARRTVASVTLEPTDATTRIMATSERAFVEPFGITVQPCTLKEESARLLAGIFDGPSRIRAVGEGDEGGPQARSGAGVDLSRADGGGSGPIEVRLLTFTPEIVGLAKPLSSNMAVRITELVAWVALHGSKGTTAESILDHGIAGATTIKTVYNMVSAARAALGVDATGSPRMITERSTGIYRLTEEVTVDVLRFEQMAERGVDTEDSQLAALLCEAALVLIEDTPVGNGTGRYGWWSSTWEARIGRLATKAAGRLAELARHGVIDLEVARWGIERARLTAGGEEELHRVAMVLEAWAGNDSRVEGEWEMASTESEEREPGSAPGDDTGALLSAIRRRASGDVLAVTKG